MNSLIQTNLNKSPNISLDKESLKLKENLLQASKKIGMPDSKESLGTATQSVEKIKKLLRLAEQSRVAEKAPALEYGRMIDSEVAKFTLELEAEIERLEGNPKKRIKGLITLYVETEQERVRKEQEAIDEQKRKAEAEAAEAVRKLEEVNRQKTVTLSKAIKTTEAVEKAVEKMNQLEQVAAPKITQAAGLNVKMVVMHEITDAKALYEARPEFFNLEPRQSVIKAAINKDTKLPGLKVWEAVDARVR